LGGIQSSIDALVAIREGETRGACGISKSVLDSGGKTEGD